MDKPKPLKHWTILISPMTQHLDSTLLKQYKHVFALTPTDMVGVHKEVIEHKLMIKQGEKEIMQKKRLHFEIS